MPEPEETRPAPADPSLNRRAIGLEVGAVLAVGVIPNLIAAITSLQHPPGPPLPYWLDSLQLTILSGCTIFVTLYLIHRSQEPWRQFGITRLTGWDAPLALILLFVAEWIWIVLADVLPRWSHSNPDRVFFPHPHGFGEHAMMVLKYLVAASAEEIVTRAYLITRLKVLLRSPSQAVLFAAIAFASYHAYQGVVGVAYTFALGLAYGVAFLLIGRVWPLAFAHALIDMRIDMGAG